MLKKIVLFVGLILSPHIFASEFMQCNFDKELGGGNDERISEIRERAFDSCLKCEGSSCKMLLYPLESDPAKFCKRVFCTPKKIRNQSYLNYSNKPIEISLRNVLAKTYDIKNIQNIVKEIKALALNIELN